MTERELVEAFHRAMGIPVREKPEMPIEAERLLRCRLLLEETKEFIRASGCVIVRWSDGTETIESRPDLVGEPDLAAMAHENADVRAISLGTDVTLGAPPEVFREVMRANAEKTPNPDPTKKPIKGPGWKPADVAGVLERHQPSPGDLDNDPWGEDT